MSDTKNIENKKTQDSSPNPEPAMMEKNLI